MRAEGDEVAEEAHTVGVADGEPGGGDHLGERMGIEPPWQRVARPPPAIDADQGLSCLGELPGKNPGQHDGEPLGGDEAEVPVGSEHRGERGERGLGVVDDLESAVAAHEVDEVATQDVGKGVGVALHRGDALGDPGLGAAPGQGGQGIRARVDHGDVVAALSQRHGETAGAPAEVEDAQGPAELALASGGEVVHRGPDRRGAQRGLDAAAASASLLVGQNWLLCRWPAAACRARRCRTGPTLVP